MNSSLFKRRPQIVSRLFGGRSKIEFGWYRPLPERFPASSHGHAGYRRSFVRVSSRQVRALQASSDWAPADEIETSVQVYDLLHLTKEPCCNLKRRAAVMQNQGRFWAGTFGASPNAIRNAGARGVTDDTARTAREITAMVADYYAKNGGSLLGKTAKPKILAQGRGIALNVLG